jgi:hypothetical protein
MPLKEYERLMEDLHDLAVVAERRDEEAISLDEMKRRLREDGLKPPSSAGPSFPLNHGYGKT